MSNGQQKKIGKKLKTYTQALGMPSIDKDNKENDQLKNRETVVQKKNLKATNNEKEKELKQVINGMKGQIDKLF